MKGAAAVPPAKTMIIARNNRISNKGKSQYFFRCLTNAQRSSRISIINILRGQKREDRSQSKEV
jgi:hypothetical protein